VHPSDLVFKRNGYEKNGTVKREKLTGTDRIDRMKKQSSVADLSSVLDPVYPV
jgi:hypothetical protein